MIVFCIDRFCGEREAYIPFRNRGMYFGEGIFETMRAENGNINFLQKHLWRLISSAAYFSIPVSYSADELRTIIIELLQKNSLTDAIVRISLSGGEIQSYEKYSSRSTSSLLCIEAKQYQRTFPDETTICFSSSPLLHGDLLRQHKTTQYLRNVMEARTARENGFDEAIFTDEQFHILEGTRTNIFILKEGKIITPALSCGILPGVMRSVVAEICTEHSLLFEERIITRNEIEEAEEMFLTNALNGIIPVHYFAAQRLLKNGRTSALQQFFHKKKSEFMQ